MFFNKGEKVDEDQPRGGDDSYLAEAAIQAEQSSSTTTTEDKNNELTEGQEQTSHPPMIAQTTEVSELNPAKSSPVRAQPTKSSATQKGASVKNEEEDGCAAQGATSTFQDDPSDVDYTPRKLVKRKDLLSGECLFLGSKGVWKEDLKTYCTYTCVRVCACVCVCVLV